MTTLKRRPWFVTAAAGAAAAIAMLVVPISYEHITAHGVTLRVSGAGLGMEGIQAIAKQLRSTLHSEGVRVEATSDGGAPTFVLETTVPARAGIHADKMARAFSDGLAKLGYSASVATTPQKARVSGTVYAFARDLVIEVSTDGKSAAQLETEIRQRLVDAGVENAQVSVTDLGGEKRQVQVKVEAIHEGDGSREPEVVPELVLKKNGAPIDGDRCQVQVMKKKTASGMELVIRVESAGKTAEATIPNADSMSDAALAAEIEAQIERAGMPVVVTVTAGKIEVRPEEKR